MCVLFKSRVARNPHLRGLNNTDEHVIIHRIQWHVFACSALRHGKPFFTCKPFEQLHTVIANTPYKAELPIPFQRPKPALVMATHDRFKVALSGFNIRKAIPIANPLDNLKHLRITPVFVRIAVKPDDLFLRKPADFCWLTIIFRAYERKQALYVTKRDLSD